MMSDSIKAARILACMLILTGVFYPLSIWAIGHLAFPAKAEGSLVARQDKVVGSWLIAQEVTAARYFHPRPSAAAYATIPSGASNQASTSASLRESVLARRQALGKDAPADMLFASGSGLDPDISPQAAQFQLDRVAKARGLDQKGRTDLENLVRQATERRQFGVFGQPRVNVLRLNLALDEEFP